MDIVTLDRGFELLGGASTLIIHGIKRLSPRFEDWFDTKLSSRERQAWMLRIGLVVVLAGFLYQVYERAMAVEDFTLTFQNLLPIINQSVVDFKDFLIAQYAIYGATKLQVREARGGGRV